MHSETLAVPPELREYFSFPFFNRVQSKCFDSVWKNGDNLLVSAPTSSGKTTIFELALLREMSLLEPMEIQKLKAIYICPLKSLCQEKLAEWRVKFRNKLLVNEITGDTSGVSPVQDYVTLSESNLILTTPEKWDSITRKFHEQKEKLSSVRILMVDEVHLLGSESRGSALEAVIARMIFQFEHNKQRNPLRIVAVSATIANPDDLASWLRVPKENKLIFTEDYRSVPLEKHVYGYESRCNPYQFEKYLSMKVLDVIRKHSDGKPSLVFCSTQKGTVEACQIILQNCDLNEFIDGNEHGRLLVQRSAEVDDNKLRTFLVSGVGFHNGSLSCRSRNVVESLFRDGLLKVLCTTTTLAQGVNLPARLVVVKSTACYCTTGIREYTQIELQQIIGRAGRPQYDHRGVAVIMTEKTNLRMYLELTTSGASLEPLESSLLSQLAEHLNAEIVLGTFSDTKTAKEYFENTLMFIRLKDKVALTKKINECIEKLEKGKLITLSRSTGKFSSRPVGIEVSKFYINIETILRFEEGISQSPNNSAVTSKAGILNLLTKAQEFEKMKPKQNEKKALRELNDKLPQEAKLSGAISTFEKKAHVMIVSAMNRIDPENWDLNRQSQEYLSVAWRVVMCFKKFLAEERIPKGFYEAVLLTKEIEARSNRTSPKLILQQIPGVGDKIAGNLVQNGVFNLDLLKFALEKKRNTLESSGLNEGRIRSLKAWVSDLGTYSVITESQKPGVLKVQILCQRDSKQYFSLVVWSESEAIPRSLYLRSSLRLNRKEPLSFEVSFGKKDLPIRIWFLNEQIVGENTMVYYSGKTSGQETPKEEEEDENKLSTRCVAERRNSCGTLDKFLFEQNKKDGNECSGDKVKKKNAGEKCKNTVDANQEESMEPKGNLGVLRQIVNEGPSKKHELFEFEELKGNSPVPNGIARKVMLKFNGNHCMPPNKPNEMFCHEPKKENQKQQDPIYHSSVFSLQDKKQKPIETKITLENKKPKQAEMVLEPKNSEGFLESMRFKKIRGGKMNILDVTPKQNGPSFPESTKEETVLKKESIEKDNLKRVRSSLISNTQNEKENVFTGTQSNFQTQGMTQKKTIIDLSKMTINNIFSTMIPKTKFN